VTAFQSLNRASGSALTSEAGGGATLAPQNGTGKSYPRVISLNE